MLDQATTSRHLGLALLQLLVRLLQVLKVLVERLVHEILRHTSFMFAHRDGRDGALVSSLAPFVPRGRAHE